MIDCGGIVSPVRFVMPNVAFGEWRTLFGHAKMTAALLDRAHP